METDIDRILCFTCRMWACSPWWSCSLAPEQTSCRSQTSSRPCRGGRQSRRCTLPSTAHPRWGQASLSRLWGSQKQWRCGGFHMILFSQSHKHHLFCFWIRTHRISIENRKFITPIVCLASYGFWNKFIYSNFANWSWEWCHPLKDMKPITLPQSLCKATISYICPFNIAFTLFY